MGLIVFAVTAGSGCTSFLPFLLQKSAKCIQQRVPMNFESKTKIIHLAEKMEIDQVNHLSLQVVRWFGRG